MACRTVGSTSGRLRPVNPRRWRRSVSQRARRTGTATRRITAHPQHVLSQLVQQQVKTVQHGLEVRGPRSAVTRELVCSPQTLDAVTLAAQRCDVGEEIRNEPLENAYYRKRSPDWSRVDMPLLIGANWGGQRHLDRFEERTEDDRTIPRIRWTRLHLDPGRTPPVSSEPMTANALSFDARGNGLPFVSAPLPTTTELTGPSALKLCVPSSTEDADLFIVLREFALDGEDVTFQGEIDPHTPISQGWLRASHRRLDPALSRPWRPYHQHDRRELLEPGVTVVLDIEIWPTCLVLPAGYRIALTVQGRDCEQPKASGARLSNFKNKLRGCGPFLHDDPHDRPRETFGGRTALPFGPAHPAWVLLPVIPPRES